MKKTVTEAQKKKRKAQELEELFEAPLDELDRELAVRVSELEAGKSLERIGEAGEKPRFGYGDVQRNRPMAIFGYCSILFALPVFLVPLFQRESEFALHHAKAAGATYLLGMSLLVASLSSCAVFLPLVFLCYIPALIGIHRATAGVEAGKAGLGEIGERIFQRIEVKK